MSLRINEASEQINVINSAALVNTAPLKQSLMIRHIPTIISRGGNVIAVIATNGSPNIL
ncbi:MAG: hypothetical protein VYB73_03720 [Verrucomicrobiota bacterium]|nr:hypothetical protein [Verrucomicrobiota bacterium]